MINDIIDIINREYSNHNFNVSSLVEKCDYCSDTLRDRLNIEMNITPSKLIENTRIEKAFHLLYDSNKINEVYKKCGFATARAFRFAFKRRTGLSPSQFKETIITEDELNKMILDLWSTENNKRY